MLPVPGPVRNHSHNAPGQVGPVPPHLLDLEPRRLDQVDAFPCAIEAGERATRKPKPHRREAGSAIVAAPVGQDQAPSRGQNPGDFAERRGRISPVMERAD